MKIPASIFFLLIYLFALNSWSANLHLCGEEIMSVAIFNNDKPDCCCNDMECNGCEDRAVTIESHDDHEYSSKTFTGPDKIVWFKNHFCELVSNGKTKTFSRPIKHIPPLIHPGDIYLLQRSLLI